MDELTAREKIILGCCAGAALLAFFPWFSVSFGSENQGMGEFMRAMGGSTSASGIEAWQGILAFLALLAAGGLIFADRRGMLPWDKQAKLLAPLVAVAVAFVCTLLYMASGGQGSVEMMGMSAGRTLWYYVALIVTGVAGYHAFLRWSEGSRTAAPEDAPTD